MKHRKIYFAASSIWAGHWFFKITWLALFGNRQDRTERKGLAGQRGADKPKRKENAKLEIHKDYIDIQIPLSGTEIMGYTAAQDCLPVDAPYNAEKDITFFEGLAEDYIAVKPGMFAIFFPQDGHAPGITPDGVKK